MCPFISACKLKATQQGIEYSHVNDVMWETTDRNIKGAYSIELTQIFVTSLKEAIAMLLTTVASLPMFPILQLPKK